MLSHNAAPMLSNNAAPMLSNVAPTTTPNNAPASTSEPTNQPGSQAPAKHPTHDTAQLSGNEENCPGNSTELRGTGERKKESLFNRSKNNLNLALSKIGKLKPQSGPKRDKHKSFRERKPPSIKRLDVSLGRSSGREESIQQQESNNSFEANVDGFLQDGSIQIGDYTINENGMKRKTAVGHAIQEEKECCFLAIEAPETRLAGVHQLPLTSQFIRTKCLGQGSSAIVYESVHAPTLSLVAEKVLAAFDPVLHSQMVSELLTMLTASAKIKLGGSPTSHPRQLEASASHNNNNPEWESHREWHSMCASMIDNPFTSADMHTMVSNHKVLSDAQSNRIRELMKSSAKKAEERPPSTPGLTNGSQYIVGIYDVFTNATDGSVSIVQELMQGGSLHDALQQNGAMPEPMLGYIAFCVLNGLCYLQELKYVHGDIKPENLLFTNDGDVKISDFGISQKLADSKARSARSSTGEASAFMGTLRYMSPERICHQGYKYPADIWSLGLSLYTCALGEFPLQIGNRWDLMSALSGGSLDQLPADANELTSRLDPARFSPELRSFIMQCLNKDPHKRPTARQLLSHPFVRSTRPESAWKYTAVPKNLVHPRQTASHNKVNGANSRGSKVVNNIGKRVVSPDFLASPIQGRDSGVAIHEARHIAWLTSHWYQAALRRTNNGAEQGRVSYQSIASPQLKSLTQLQSHVRLSREELATVVRKQAEQVVRSGEVRCFEKEQLRGKLSVYHSTSTLRTCEWGCTTGILRKRATRRPLSLLSVYKWDDRAFVLKSGVISYHKCMTNTTSNVHSLDKKMGEILLQPGTCVFAAGAEFAGQFQSNGVSPHVHNASFLSKCIVLKDVKVNNRKDNETMYLIAGSAADASSWVNAIHSDILHLKSIYLR